MKVIYYTKPEESTKHVINFFRVLGCIKVNALGKDALEKQESKDAPERQESKLSITLTIPISLELLIQNTFEKN